MQIDITDYSMPAEWEEHARSFIAWPVKSSLLYPENYDDLCKGYAGFINAICGFEPVSVIINDGDLDYARALCSQEADFIAIEHDDAWMRDNGPTFVRSADKLAGIDWRFNAWGEKHSNFYLDDQAAEKLLDMLGIPSHYSSMVLEGGSIHTDGEGTLLTTEQCLLNGNRNPYHTKNQIEDELKKCLGIKKIIWIAKGLAGDETDGHIDNEACFAAGGKVLLQTCSNINDINYNIGIESRNILRRETDAAGRKLDIIEIEQPPLRRHNGRRLTLSYINFYIVNGGIIMPVFGADASKTDDAAAAVLREAFPGRKIVTVDGTTVITEGGNVHCITQQMPKGINAK